jgi:hypothetical protein
MASHGAWPTTPSRAHHPLPMSTFIPSISPSSSRSSFPRHGDRATARSPWCRALGTTPQPAKLGIQFRLSLLYLFIVVSMHACKGRGQIAPLFLDDARSAMTVAVGTSPSCGSRLLPPF